MSLGAASHDSRFEKVGMAIEVVEALQNIKTRGVVESKALCRGVILAEKSC
jgi:hypothetical protein